MGLVTQASQIGSYNSHHKKKKTENWVCFIFTFIMSFFVFVLGMVLKIELVKEPKR